MGISSFGEYGGLSTVFPPFAREAVVIRVMRRGRKYTQNAEFQLIRAIIAVLGVFSAGKGSDREKNRASRARTQRPSPGALIPHRASRCFITKGMRGYHGLPAFPAPVLRTFVLPFSPDIAHRPPGRSPEPARYPAPPVPGNSCPTRREAYPDSQTV